MTTVPGPSNPGICVFSGRMVNPLDLQPADVTVQDIAHGLALVNRFAGHSVKPISVAQHSVYVSRLCEEVSEDLAWEALFHDGSEAYLGDMPKWVKHSPEMLAFRVAEDRAQHVINLAMGVYVPLAPSLSLEKLFIPKMSPEVKEADKLMVRFEARQAFGKSWINPNGYPDPTPEELERIGKWAAWPWRKAEEAFLVQFRLLNGPDRLAKAAQALVDAGQLSPGGLALRPGVGFLAT